MKPNRESLTDRVVRSLKSDIASGRYAVGAALPSEPFLVKQFGVSRTVIREALAGLKAAGLIDTRQGAGVYVLEPTPKAESGPMFSLDYEDLADILEFLELRMAMEIEAAGLAADRCTGAQQMKIYQALLLMKGLIEEGQSAEDADYDFHFGIAVATNNRRYVDFFNFIPPKVITRSRFCKRPVDPEQQLRYMEELYLEHQHIYQALANKDAAAAREAMRTHLVNSKARYESLLMKAPDTGA